MAAKFDGVVHLNFHPDLSTTLCGLPIPEGAELFKASGDTITCQPCRQEGHKRFLKGWLDWERSRTLKQVREEEEEEWERRGLHD